MEKKIEEYSCYCTEKQALKAFELNVPLRYVFITQRESLASAKKIIRSGGHPYYTYIDNFQQPGAYWCKLITIPTVEQMVNFLIETERGHKESLSDFIKANGYKDGCLAFINECLNIVEEDD